MSYIRSSDGTRIHYQVTGRPGAPPILFIQGLGADKNGWNLQRLATAPWYRAVALDNRGAGRSDKPHGTYDLEQMADDAVAVPEAGFVAIGQTGYEYTYVELDPGVHEASSAEPFGLYVYGYNNAVSFSYIGGLAVPGE